MIQLENISFTYGSNDTDSKESIHLNGICPINIRIKKGEFIVLTGGSGCGKTTVTRFINGLIPNYYEGKQEGHVKLNNQSMDNMTIADTSKIVGSVFQNPRSQFFNVDTTSELAFASENQGIDVAEIKERIASVSSEFQIQALLGRSIFELSGGEKQKIACASVAVADPEIIVLDEPSSNLDMDAIEDLTKVLKHWKAQGKTIVIAEHRLYFLKDLADRMFIMKKGEFVEELNGQQIKELTISGVKKRGLRPLSLSDLSVQDFRTNSDQKMETQSSIELKDFEFLYKDKIHGIRIPKLKVNNNSIIAIIGRNGAGKSTFARCLCGLEKKCKGMLITDKQSMTTKQRIRNCYMVMQDVNHQLFTESVLDEVVLSMTDKVMTDEDKQVKAMQILEKLDLKSLSEEHPMSLSGGQKQRVAVASTIASERKIIIFDEPTSGLDYEHMCQVAEMIRNLKKMGKTVFVITHDLEFILSCCTDVLYLEEGKVVEQYELTRESETRLLHFFLHEKEEKVV